MRHALARRPTYLPGRYPQGLGVTYSAQALPASFSAPSATSIQQSQAAAPTGTTYIIAGALTTAALGVLIYLATR
jgi:hypothetical protein